MSSFKHSAKVRARWRRQAQRYRRSHPDYSRRNNERYRLKQIATDKKAFYQRVAANVRAWRERNPLRAKAQRAVFIVLRAGRLKKRPCPHCHSTKVQAHNDDYSEPLNAGCAPAIMGF